jgi:uncharacterized damage-inducible protein DinB
MKRKDILTIYEYNYWANRRILASSSRVTQEQLQAPASYPYGGLRGTLVHILDTEWGWRTVFQATGPSPVLQEADFPDANALEVHWHKEESAMRAYLESLTDADVEGHIHYTTDLGEERDRILWHALLHVVNHGTQHRSEAAALLTGYGQSPGDLDFTVFLNEWKK